MLRGTDIEAGIRVGDHPGAEPRRRPAAVLARFGGHVLLVAVWLLVLTMGALTWAPHATKFKTDVIVGQSMEPTIPLYSVIVVEPVPAGQLRAGDIITFEQPQVDNRKVTHRIERVERRTDGKLAFVTKGDNNEARDPWRVTYEGTGYRVRTHVPHVGRLMLAAQEPIARIVLVLLPTLLVLGMVLRWVWGSWGTEPTGHRDDGVLLLEDLVDEDGAPLAHDDPRRRNDIPWDEWEYAS